MYELLTLGIVAIAALFFQEWLQRKERRELLNRIMSKDYSQFEYYQKMFREEVDELGKLRDEARDEKKKEVDDFAEEDREYAKEKTFVEQVEEDFPVEDVDLPKLREILTKEE